jgi:hypothetical protein
MCVYLSINVTYWNIKKKIVLLSDSLNLIYCPLQKLKYYYINILFLVAFVTEKNSNSLPISAGC